MGTWRCLRWQGCCVHEGTCVEPLGLRRERRRHQRTPGGPRTSRQQGNLWGGGGAGSSLEPESFCVAWTRHSSLDVSGKGQSRGPHTLAHPKATVGQPLLVLQGNGQGRA